MSLIAATPGETEPWNAILTCYWARKDARAHVRTQRKARVHTDTDTHTPTHAQTVAQSPSIVWHTKEGQRTRAYPIDGVISGFLCGVSTTRAACPVVCWKAQLESTVGAAACSVATRSRKTLVRRGQHGHCCSGRARASGASSQPTNTTPTARPTPLPPAQLQELGGTHARSIDTDCAVATSATTTTTHTRAHTRTQTR